MQSRPRTTQGPDTASRQVAAGLRARIDCGELFEGAQLPSERRLAETYGVARNTAREAVRLLSEAGLVTAEQGRGVFVRHRPSLMRLGQRRYSRRLREQTGVSPFHAEVLAQGQTPSAYMASIARVPPPPAVAERLDVDRGSPSVVRRENWYFADGEPVQTGVTWIPWEIAKGTVLAGSDDLGVGDLYARFEDQGHLITSTREEISARMPTAGERAGLRMAGGVPVIVVLHTGIDQDERPFEVTEFVMRADRMGLDYTLSIDD